MAVHVSRRLLQASGRFAAASSPEAMEVDSEVVVVLSSLLGALICVVGLALAARCAWLRRRSWGLRLPPTTAMDKGLGQDALRSLPKGSFQPGGPADEGGLSFAECPICLAEFAEGDEVRVLPQCGHRFHVACVHLWLGSRSSCPSCRRVLVAGAGGALECQYSGAGSSVAASSAPAEAAQAASPPAQEEMEGRAKAREEGGASTFVPQ